MLSHFSRIPLSETLIDLNRPYSPGKNIEVGCHALLQGIFPTQGLNLLLSLTSPALAGVLYQ